MKGKLFLILGSSGSGKGTVLAGLRDRHPEFVFPKSCTTRKPRENKTGEEVYHFVSKDEFKKMIDEGDFLEWAQVHGEHYYGTMKQPIMDALNAGHIVVREVDVQG
ncbi:guanylate kinase, partial [Candidatus Peregrinibacteria bacterium CG10_big_fil_rev_8_21_14_0_10_44_7]